MPDNGIIRFEVWPPRPKGGQQVGPGPQGIRGVHFWKDGDEIGSGIEACCGWERSQHRNKRIVEQMIEWALSEIRR